MEDPVHRGEIGAKVHVSMETVCFPFKLADFIYLIG